MSDQLQGETQQRDGPRGDALRDFFDLLEKDSQGQWNFKSLSRDAAKFQDVVERFANAFPHALDPARVFVEAAFSYLNSISNSTICTDRSCIRCRIADVAFEVQRTLSAVATASPAPADAHQVRCVHGVPEGLTCAICGPIRNDDPPTLAPAESTRVEGEQDTRARLESIAEPWICAEEKPCEEAVPVHWDEMITALTTAEQRVAAAPADNDGETK